MSGNVKDPYLVQVGDTIAKIAKQNGCSITELCRLNNLAQNAPVTVGQTLYLSERTAFGFVALFLDALRGPIENLNYQLHFDGKTVTGSTGINGLSCQVITKDGKSQVEVWVKDFSANWQKLAQVVSGYGNKLTTLVSGYVVTPGGTEPHPEKVPYRLPSPAPTPKPTSVQPPTPLKPTGEPTKNNPKKKKRKKRDRRGSQS